MFKGAVSIVLLWLRYILIYDHARIVKFILLHELFLIIVGSFLRLHFLLLVLVEE